LFSSVSLHASTCARHRPSLHDALPILLVTSGLDGLFPPGLPVGTISAVQPATSAFVSAHVEPAAHVERTKLLLVLLAEPQALPRSEEHTSELQSRENLVCRLLLEKKTK